MLFCSCTKQTAQNITPKPSSTRRSTRLNSPAVDDLGLGQIVSLSPTYFSLFSVEGAAGYLGVDQQTISQLHVVNFMTHFGGMIVPFLFCFACDAPCSMPLASDVLFCGSLGTSAIAQTYGMLVVERMDVKALPHTRPVGQKDQKTLKRFRATHRPIPIVRHAQQTNSPTISTAQLNKTDPPPNTKSAKPWLIKRIVSFETNMKAACSDRGLY